MKKQVKIALVIGHRPKAPGAYGNKGISEFNFNKELAHEIMEKLEGDPMISVRIFYREKGAGSYSRKMKHLHRDIDAWGANISISMHFNAASNPKASGHEILYCSKTGKKFAKILNQLFNRTIEGRDRGIKKKTRRDRGGSFLCQGNSYCILSEPFFASHQDKFVEGGPLRGELIESYVYFIKVAAHYYEGITDA